MRTIALLAALLFAASCRAQVPFAWDADASAAAPGRKDVYQGETVPLRPSWTGDGVRTNGWAFALLWQTNGMGGAWWSDTADAFTWKPSRDCGADRYTLFVRAVAPGGGVSYRANALFRMLPSPGFAPAALPSPDLYPDLAARLAPYMAAYTQGLALASGVTNEAAVRASADSALQMQITSLAESGTVTGGVIAAGSAADTAVWRDSADSNLFARLENGAGTVYRVSDGVQTNAVCTLMNGFGIAVAHAMISPEHVVYSAPPNTMQMIGGNWSIVYDPDNIGLWQVNNSSFQACWQAFAPDQPLPITAYPTDGINSLVGTAVFTYQSVAVPNAVTNPVATFAYAGDVISSTNDLWQAIVALRAQSGAASSNLVAATNYIIRTYLISSNAWITANFSNRTVAVSLVLANGATNTVTVGGSQNSIDPQATNLLWLALGAGIAAKADKAWGKYAPDGGANPDPAYMTFLNAPATVFGSGCSWSTCGTYAALSSSGTVAFNSGSNGVFSIGPDSTNRFGYTAGGSVLVGAVPLSLRTQGAGTPDGYAWIDYEYSGGDFPVLWFAPSLSVDFQTVESAVWTDNNDGTATAIAPAASAGGFFKATTAAAAGVVFFSAMPARFDGGVFGSPHAFPVKYDSTITITSGGRTYRVPAELAD